MLILDKICLSEFVSVSYFPHFEVLISLFRRWSYMECFFGTDGILGVPAGNSQGGL